MKAKKAIALILSISFLAVIFTFGIWVHVKTPTVLSLAERRELSLRPVLTLSALADGSYFDKAEDFLLDQFPGREVFRRIKAVWQYDVLGKKENNHITFYEGYAAELTDDITAKSQDVYLKRINKLYETYFADAGVHVYTTLIPDKTVYFPDFYPRFDYDSFVKRIKDNFDGTFIDIADTLSLDSYFSTDLHWRQDKIIGTANRILSAMGAETIEEYELSAPLSPFYGVYYGQSALPLEKDELILVETAQNKAASLRHADILTGELVNGLIYDTEKLQSNDPYDVFLGGANSTVIMENPLAEGGKTLYLISDSFGRSLSPLLLSDYSRIVFFDLRYINPSVAFSQIPIEEGSDVLIAYSVTAVDVSSNIRTD